MSEKMYQIIENPFIKNMDIGQYILVDGEPVKEPNTFKWAMWLEAHRKECRVALTKLKGNVQVSTVFLGLDHNWGKDSEPILYETMVFGGEHDGHRKRYSTKQEALKGHRETVEMVGDPFSELMECIEAIVEKGFKGV